MNKIKFGTDGWRAIIAKEYTIENVSRVAQATGEWMIQNNYSKLVIGYDCRFGGLMFSETAASVLAAMGITVLIDENFVTTPMVAMGIIEYKADLGIVITASHNPPLYNGFKLKSKLGGPSLSEDTEAIEALIPEKCTISPAPYEEYKLSGLIHVVDLEEIYYERVMQTFDIEEIRQAGLRFVYDAMYGAGQKIFVRIFPEILQLHCMHNPTFYGVPPEPLAKHLVLMSQLVGATPYTCCGIATDGDADRIAMMDENGQYLDSHRMLLVTLYYLAEYKGMKGKVVFSTSITDKMKKLAEHYGMPYEVTKIGFKHIAEIMSREEILLGGEESGGIAIKGHIPERDGIWTALTILEFIARSGKTLSTIFNEIYAIVGNFAYDRHDLQISEALKKSIVEKCNNDRIKEIGGRPIIHTEKIDGHKYYLSDEEWVMVRPSGTEPVLRIYAQAPDMEKVEGLLSAAYLEVTT